jgi:hypothetical protein
MNQEHYAAVRYAMVIGFIAGGIDQFENPSLTAGFAVAALHTELLPILAALRENPELVELSRRVGLSHLFGSFSGGNGSFSGGNRYFSGGKTKQSKKTAARDFFTAFDKLSNENKTVLDGLVKRLAPAFLSTSSLARRKTAKSHQ